MSFWTKWRYPIMAAAATIAAPYAAPALAGLFGGGAAAAGAAGAGAAAGEAGGGLLAGELASQALPGMMEAGTLPALAPMDAMTFPAGAMPADPLQWSMADELASLGSAGPAEGGASQYAAAGDIKGLLGVAKNRLAGALEPLGDPRVKMAAQLMRGGQRQQAPMMAAAPPQPMPYEPVSRSLTPAEQRRYRALGSFIA